MLNLSTEEYKRLYFQVNNLLVESTDSVNFGSEGWWLWKEYDKQAEISINEKIYVNDAKEYRFTVSLEHDKAKTSMEHYSLNLNLKMEYDNAGIGILEKQARVKVGNLDYQKEQTGERDK